MGHKYWLCIDSTYVSGAAIVSLLLFMFHMTCMHLQSQSRTLRCRACIRRQRRRLQKREQNEEAGGNQCCTAFFPLGHVCMTHVTFSILLYAWWWKQITSPTNKDWPLSVEYVPAVQRVQKMAPVESQESEYIAAKQSFAFEATLCSMMPCVFT